MWLKSHLPHCRRLPLFYQANGKNKNLCGNFSLFISRKGRMKQWCGRIISVESRVESSRDASPSRHKPFESESSNRFFRVKTESNDDLVESPKLSIHLDSLIYKLVNVESNINKYFHCVVSFLNTEMITLSCSVRYWSKKTFFLFKTIVTVCVNKTFGYFVKMTQTRVWSHILWLESSHSVKNVNQVITTSFLNVVRVESLKIVTQVESLTRITLSLKWSNLSLKWTNPCLPAGLQSCSWCPYGF